MSEERTIVKPEPARLLAGLRDTGYSFNTAVADIIDNSIAADATLISIVVAQLFSGDIRVSIADNGYGMDKEGLVSAMTYGAPPRNTKHSLGKFGLGLKTASTSCCKRLKVASRISGESGINCAVWDLDFIAKERDWYLQFTEPSMDDIEELNAVAPNHSGTIVVWENCDRLLSARYKNPNTSAFKEAFLRSLEELKQHIAMVYARFLDENDKRAQNVVIKLNGEAVNPWDPFCREYDGPVSSTTFTAVFNDEDGTSSIQLNCYIVPAKDELDTLSKRQRVMPSEKNTALKSFSEESLSGFYIYRENRLIHWGDWFNMPGIDFHKKLCRFELSFGEELDEVFQVDIKKSRITLNDELRGELIDFVRPITKEGDKRYRGTERKAAKKAAKGMHEEAERKISEEERKLTKYPLQTDESGNVFIYNSHGRTQTDYQASDSGPIFRVEDQLTDGILWEPALISGQNGVRINGGHEFYKRYYGANKDNPNAIIGLDYFIWALANAETQVIDSDAQDNLSDARYETSRYLRRLARDMPDVSVEDFEDGEE